MSEEKTPTMIVIDSLFTVCDVFDQFPDCFKKMRNGKFSLQISGRYKFEITKVEKKDE